MSGARPESVRRSLSWTLLGELVFAAAQWLALMVVAKLGSPEALGRYSLGLAVATPIFVFANLHLRPVFVVAAEGRWAFAHAFALRLVALPLALAATAGFCLVRGWPWETAVAVLLVGLIRASGCASDILYARAQRAETMRSIGISRALRGGLWIGLLALGLRLGGEVAALALVAAGLAAVTLFYDLPRAAALGEPGSARPRFDWPQLRALARHALPMGLAAGLLGFTLNAPAYVLEGSHGLEVVGFFAAVLSIIQASGVFNMALGNAAIPRLARLSAEDARGFWALLAKLLAAVAALNGAGLLIVIVAGDLYLRYAYTPAYVAYHDQLILAAVAAVIVGLANMLSQTLTALSRFRAQLVINAVALAVSIAVAAWRIPARGLDGAIETLLALAGFRFVVYLGANLALGPRHPR
ncbi:hypothetical protein G6O69_37450 [Pseudenhygromyxa sp. WMMC2535]|uniref:lipopolysaccharide biosynthesis protein n=1 Tax=Pseudenhygromyxa sp. WMMC2535 TaxID=2712867 RepID=UPI0015549C9A|nr:hypothetical protein [Pseudenhygromyxa sp. WMMC2535]NVB37197.1 hypothetical protein [Pseudenhygromyxa sp. WMMC2535]NVB43562.1 hypothetical protein [Pseudenhygromyxa sp. WMMC2535]